MELMVTRKDLEELDKKAEELGIALVVKTWVVDNHRFYCLTDIRKKDEIKDAVDRAKEYLPKQVFVDENAKIPDSCEKYYRDWMYGSVLKAFEEAFGNG